MKKFSIPFDGETIVGEVAGAHPSILLLHGGGTGSRKRFERLRERLEKDGVGSVAFDFLGQGESSGQLAHSSLAHRVQQATTVIEQLSLQQPLTLVGASMGAYIAIRLTERYPVDRLALFVPGVYTPEAYSIRFDSGFTELIRKEGSWKRSDAWEILEKFIGDLLVVSAGKDQVIPDELVSILLKSASQTRRVAHLAFPDSPHLIFSYLDDHPDAFEQMYQKFHTLLL